ncbi:MAG: hypothetical protein HYU75_08180, partial [Betaproteobacteria bacterium]|nr:hypothetical protein [Betaproteobacteria bacterium]
MTVESSPLRGGATVGALVAGVLARSLLASALGLAVPAAASVHDAAAEGAEARLERVLQAVRGGKLPAALEEVNRLVERYPNWRLAHLVHGDLLLARAAPITGFGNARQAAGDRLEDLRAEALARR